MKRFIWVDYAKTIGIYLVILGHSYICTPINEIIYTFHMPLFFFLSGYLFSFERYPSFKKFAWKRFKSLLVPYLWINLITYLFWLLIGRNYGHDAHIGVVGDKFNRAFAACEYGRPRYVFGEVSGV